MAKDTPKMGLHTWDQALDLYDYVQLTQNWQTVDFHDHTPGRGVPIPAGGIAPGAVSTAQLASTVPLVPTGGIILYGNSIAPTGFLLCDGTAYQQSAYPALYAVIGATYANSPPALYFNVPSIANMVLTHGTVYYIIKT